MSERTFDLASFSLQVGATAKERSALRQDLVRGLKDYYESLFGYDKYGGETIFLLSERMGYPYVYGFAVHRMVHDRRISDRTKTAVTQRALEITEYGEDFGIPYGFFAALHFLAQRKELTSDDLRWGLLVSAGELDPFRGVDKADVTGFFRWLVSHEQLPAEERAFWGHSLIARHQDRAGAADLINSLLGAEAIPAEVRRELAQAWVNFRQPRIAVSSPPPGEGRAAFVAEHMPFWIAHMPSWPSHGMIRLGLIWLARLGPEPFDLARRYLAYGDAFADQIHLAVADIIAEHHEAMPPAGLRNLIDKGIGMSGSITTRRKFYRLGADLFGDEYLQKASGDTANSVRQWAAKQLAGSREL